MKLFEIPVYALSKQKLEEKVSAVANKKRQQYQENGRDEEHIKIGIALATSPQCNWDYNHIIGYIVVLKEKNDVLFNCYFPHQVIKRYDWHTTEKKFLVSSEVVGAHFYCGNLKNGKQLREKLIFHLEGLITEIEKHNYFVDRESFDNIDKYLDYDKLLKG